MPCRLSRSRTWSITGLLTIGTIGFGRLIVRGRRRDPSPPAITTAFMPIVPSSRQYTLGPHGRRRDGAALARPTLLGLDRPGRDRGELPRDLRPATRRRRAHGGGQGERVWPWHRRRGWGDAGRRREPPRG